MDLIYSNVAGLDVHKKSVSACVRWIGPKGAVQEEVRQFGTMTRDILQMAEWFASRQVTHVAMESTGVFWKPIWNLLEGRFKLHLVNAYELKQVPGRKSDIRDCQWIAHLLQCGLLRSSFVPSREQRELRDLTRQRSQLTAERTRVANRIQKVLEDANIKLASVASDVLGKSGRAMIQAMISGETDPSTLADLSKRTLRRKIPQLQLALEGHLTPHHRFMLKQLMWHVTNLEQQIAAFDAEIRDRMDSLLSHRDMVRLDQIPGVDIRTIQTVVAEIGTDMSQFPTDSQLSSWATLCPTRDSSAGKVKRTHTKRGNRWLKQALSEAAWAASRTKGSYYQAMYGRIAGRRGKQRAVLAVAHSLLIVFRHLLNNPNLEYKDLGADYFLRLEPERHRRYLVKRLEALGYSVQITRKDVA